MLAPLTPTLVTQTGNGWRMVGGALLCSNRSFATLPLPGNFAGTSYQVRVKLRQIGGKEVFHVVLPVGDRMTGFELDGYGGQYTGLQRVNGKGGKDLPGVVEGKQVKDSEQHDLEVTVQLDGTNVMISTKLDGQPLYVWAGPTAALSQYSRWNTTPPGSLAFGTLAADWVVYEVQAKRLGK